ncbi:c2h2 finger domain containing protein [Grosmannia clavigera kw1407]|uniref:C2h2 finger domain containing protein n=1 Tax=Grosmannia clavigera (strain kw1407 / UAMH 11150) TaxID=655863 RepID=F0XNF1_GROCL|nr:c2h2 finger domain containing protein [Grosmannia clavigera kw1407]EFX00844.1 c2h2 finger domain containing protein [Grosmannia clavigera kw1407]
MGAEQSTNRNAGSAAQAPAALRKTCYYELLSVERTATDEEIKKAYRRKALELHPDRNFNDTENATRKFAEVQTAYEVLSDAQERAWYDSHRDAILRGDDDTADADGQEASSRFYNNVRLTPTEELYTLMGRFNSNVPFTDSPTGFFGILNETFAQLALEEETVCSWDGQEIPIQYPPFGEAADGYDAVAKPFYRDWSNFATRKSFSWKDKYRLSDAPERAVRRLMEKENKKAREQALREFNDAVRSLVAFVRKRDPRYVPNVQSEAERQKILRDSAAAQAARQRAANQERLTASYVEPEWARSRPGGETNEYEGGFSSDAESEVVEEIECVVCDKSFKSEKQFEAHEKSKKHIKAVQQLKRQMKRENAELRLDSEPEPVLAPAPEPTSEVEHNETGETIADPEDSGRTEHKSTPDRKIDGQNDDEEEEEEEDENDEYAPRDVVEKRFLPVQDDQSDGPVDADGLAAQLDDLDIGQSQASIAQAKKVGKAKAKRDKKAARQAAVAADQPDSVKTACKICSMPFASNTKLHQHLKAEHPMSEPTRKTKAGSKKKKG